MPQRGSGRSEGGALAQGDLSPQTPEPLPHPPPSAAPPALVEWMQPEAPWGPYLLLVLCQSPDGPSFSFSPLFSSRQGFKGDDNDRHKPWLNFPWCQASHTCFINDYNNPRDQALLVVSPFYR